MIQLIEQLEAIYQYSKDIHYSAKGEGFYGIHLLMDRIADGIHDQIDSIKEVAYLGYEKLPPKSEDTLKVTAAYIPELTDDTNRNIFFLQELITNTINTLLTKKPILADPALDSLLDGIAESLALKKGLLWRQAK